MQSLYRYVVGSTWRTSFLHFACQFVCDEIAETGMCERQVWRLCSRPAGLWGSASSMTAPGPHGEFLISRNGGKRVSAPFGSGAYENRLPADSDFCGPCGRR